MVAGVALVVVGRRSTRWLSPFLAGAGAVAVVVSLGEWAAQPAGSGATLTPLVLSSLAAGLAAASLVAGSRWEAAGRNLRVAALAVLVPWMLTRLEVLTEPVLPTSLPKAVDRLGTSGVLWVVAGGVALIVNSSSGRPAPPLGRRSTTKVRSRRHLHDRTACS